MGGSTGADHGESYACSTGCYSGGCEASATHHGARGGQAGTQDHGAGSRETNSGTTADRAGCSYGHAATNGRDICAYDYYGSTLHVGTNYGDFCAFVRYDY